MSSSSVNRAANSTAYRRPGGMSRHSDAAPINASQDLNTVDDAARSDGSHTGDNSAAPEEPYAKVISSNDGQRNVESGPNQIPELLGQLQQMMKEQQLHGQRARELQHQIEQDELACGRMMSVIVQTRAALDMRRTHVQEDKQKLVAEQEAETRSREAVASCVDLLGRLTQHVTIKSEPNAGDMLM